MGVCLFIDSITVRIQIRIEIQQPGLYLGHCHGSTHNNREVNILLQ